MDKFKKTIIFAIIILIIDIPWILTFMKPMYQSMLTQNNLTMSGNHIAAVLAYLVMILSFPLIINDSNPQKMLARAAALGFVIYGTYGFTLSSFLPNYNLSLALTETIWGTILYTFATWVVTRI